MSADDGWGPVAVPGSPEARRLVAEQRATSSVRPTDVVQALQVLDTRARNGARTVSGPVSVGASRHDGATDSAETAETGAVPGALSVRNALDLEPGHPTRWLALGLLPYASVAVLVGDEGIGKSLWWVLVVAYVTTGQPHALLGLPSREASTVVLVLTEDSWAEVRPRLEAVGADLSRVRVVAEDDKGAGSPQFPRDLHLITRHAELEPVALVVVDAWLDTVPGHLQVKDPQQARAALHPFKGAAEATGACVLLLAHSNRMDADDLRSRIGATSVLRQKARALVYAATPPESPGTLYVGTDKANQVGHRTALSYRISVRQVRARTADDPGTVAYLDVVGDTTRTMQEHVTTWKRQAREAERPPSADERAQAWVLAYVTEHGGEVPAAVCKADAKAAGVNVDRIPGAVQAVGGEVAPAGFQGAWVYRIPAQSQQTSPVSGAQEQR